MRHFLCHCWLDDRGGAGASLKQAGRGDGAEMVRKGGLQTAPPWFERPRMPLNAWRLAQRLLAAFIVGSFIDEASANVRGAAVRPRRLQPAPHDNQRLRQAVVRVRGGSLGASSVLPRF